MPSLGLLSLDAGAHFFQLWFKLRNTNVFLVSACCQHFCSACSGATDRAHKRSGEDFEKQFYILFFFPFCLKLGTFFNRPFPKLQRREVRACTHPRLDAQPTARGCLAPCSNRTRLLPALRNGPPPCLASSPKRQLPTAV